MNSKAIKRQLLAAIAMVLVAALALGSSTYAWFVASGTVTAEGMSVQAQSDGNLVIRYNLNDWGVSASAGMSAARDMKPVSTKDLQTWVYAQAAKPNEPKANLSTAEIVTDKIATAFDNTDDATTGKTYTNSSYAVAKWFQIRSATAENFPEGLYVSEIGVNTPTKSMSTSLRVGIACKYKTGVANEQNTYGYSYTIYAPVSLGGTDTGNNPSTTYAILEKQENGSFAYGTPSLVVSEEGANESGVPYKAIIPAGVTIDKTTPVDILIYVWFEGEDQNLYSDNFGTEGIDVAVSFTSISTAA